PMASPNIAAYPIKQMTASSVPTKALYLKVVYTLDANGNPVLDHYGAKSGTFNLGTTTISGFTDMIRNGTLGNPDVPLLSGSMLPDILDPCYVVYALNQKGAAEFRRDMDGAQTSDATYYDYYNLTHVQDDGATYPGNNLMPITPPTDTSPCHIIYFVAISPSTPGDDDLTDSFNLNVNVRQPNDTFKAGTIDPDIKNTGRPPG
ncbi:MAG TPA: hypothetical protein VFV07_06065, partial [Rhizomicrobium sp.]|nr:hypothetical protein [Rhizomicrobium sp.]